MVFDEVARRIGAEPLRVTTRRRDGDVVARATWSRSLEGSTQVTLVGERTMLNLVCRLSGHRDAHPRLGASGSRAPVRPSSTPARRRPGLRALEKYAVRAGGGTNKRMGLFDVAMIKDNHKLAAGSLSKAYAAVRAQFPDVPIQVEVTTTAGGARVGAGRGAVPVVRQHVRELLRETVQAVRATGEDVELEATGGLTLRWRRSTPRPGSTTCLSGDSRTPRRSSTSPSTSPTADARPGSHGTESQSSRWRR